MRRIFSVIALKGDFITATASHDDVSDAAFAIVDEVDLGFVPAVVGSRGVEREILSGTTGKGIAWCVLSDRREVARRIAAGCLGGAVSESDATLEKILHGGY